MSERPKRDGYLDRLIGDLVEDAKLYLEEGHHSTAAERLATNKVSREELHRLLDCIEGSGMPLDGRDMPGPQRWASLDAAFGGEPAGTDLRAALAEEKLAREKLRASSAILEKARILPASVIALRDYPEIRWAVPGLIPEGLTLFSAPPKAGKSWIALGFLLAIASGGKALGRVDVEIGRCLYLSLEDSERRIKARLERMGGVFPEALEIGTAIPRSTGLSEFLEAYLMNHDDTRLIVVDTLGRALPGGDLNDYAETTLKLDPIQRLALEHHAGIILVHHVRKGGDRIDGDPFSASLGSQGILGAMDTALILDRKRNESKAVLHVIGRDVPEASYSLALDESTMSWQMTDDPPEATRLSNERREVLEVLKKAAGPLKTGEIAAIVGRSGATVSEHCRMLETLGMLSKPSYGAWQYRNTSESAESTKS